MSKNGIRVEEFNIYSLGAEAVSYHLKDIHTLALQVTPQNIGILSLELEVELRYDELAKPYVTFAAARGTKEEPEEDRYYKVGPGCWLVILWDEIHVFQDLQFRSTFSFDDLSGPSGESKPHVHIPISELAAEAADQANKVDFVRVAEGLNQWAQDTVERTQIVPSVGELDQLEALREKLNNEVPVVGESRQPDIDAETEQRIGERIDSQPWMQQAKAKLQEEDGSNTREQQL